MINYEEHRSSYTLQKHSNFIIKNTSISIAFLLARQLNCCLQAQPTQGKLHKHGKRYKQIYSDSKHFPRVSLSPYSPGTCPLFKPLQKQHHLFQVIFLVQEHPLYLLRPDLIQVAGGGACSSVLFVYQKHLVRMCNGFMK